jgi:Tol biopolymer transport system component
VVILNGEDNVWVYYDQKTLGSLEYQEGRISPNGKWLAFRSAHDNDENIYNWTLSHSSGETLFTIGNSFFNYPIWHEDEALVGTPNGAEVYKLPEGILLATWSIPATYSSAAWAPSGEFFAYIARQGGQSNLYIIPMP